MELRHLRYLVATADAGSVSAAAQDLHVTQPGLSRQLRDLERELGVDLFDRAGGRLRLSRTGRELLPRAIAVLDAVGELTRAAAVHAAGGVERLLIAAPGVTLTDVVAPFVATMAADDPVIDVRTADGVSVGTLLREGVDLAIGTDRPPRPFTSRRLAVLPVWAYVAPDDPWASRTDVTLRELVGRPLVVLPATYTARSSLDAALTREELGVGELVEAGNGTIAQALAASGRGVAVVSDDPRFDVVPLAIRTDGGQRLAVRLSASWNPTAITAATVESLATRLAAYVEQVYGAP
ncbi:LysR family transcriptional regulator [Nocardioides sp.]|uniref:LysR family transcriptional regulator n=1 Tax=Nocardioides sp. TaxID=35761 RepID=UPI0035144603